MSDESLVFAATQAEGTAPASRTNADARIGEVVAGRYRLTDVLGYGGMGTVYGAAHLELGKRVGIKMLASSFTGNAQATARFLREAKAASTIESEHIVHVFDVGEDPKLGLFMVMELLKGEDLAQTLRRRTKLRPQDVAGIAWQVCHALERAHDAGIVHRDLKPANVFLTRIDDGSVRVKVLDFGIAKLVSDAQASRPNGDLTQVGLAVGTPQYMSPEQALAGEVDRRTDIYSLGAVLFEALAGKPAYPELETGQATMAKVIGEEAPRLRDVAPDVPRELDALVADMMARMMEARPATVGDVRMRLETLYPNLARSTLVLDALGRPGPLPLVVVEPERPETLHAPASSGDREAPTMKGPRTSGAPRRAAGAAVIAFLAVAAPSLLVLRYLAPRWLASSSAEPPAPIAAPSGAIEETIDVAELVRASQRALDRGDYMRARDLATVASRRSPTAIDAWLTLGAASQSLGDSDGAQRAYASCVAASSTAGACRDRLGR